MTERRRFALIAPNYFPLTCGVGDHTMRLAGELQRRGNDAVVFTHEPAQPNPENPKVGVRGLPGPSALAIAAGIAREIESGGFTHAVIQYTPQMWNAGRFGSPAVPMLAAFLHQRSIHTTLIMHELVTPWAHRPDLYLAAMLTRAQLASTLPACNLLFVTTESRRRFLEPIAKLLPTPRHPAVLRIGPGADPVPANAPPGGRRIGVFSTLSTGKALDVVIDAFEEIFKETATGGQPELLIIGDLGPATNRAVRALHARISASPAARHIRVTGKLPLPEIARAVASLNVYLFPMNTGANTRSSTLPVPLAAGVPVVATRGAETDAIFEDRKNVYFASGLDGGAFARAAMDLFRDPDLARQIADGGRRLYHEHLAWNHTGQELMDAISRSEAMYSAQAVNWRTVTGAAEATPASETAPGTLSERQKTTVLYIAGWGRSGSTIMGNILGQLPGFAHVGELSNVWTRGVIENAPCGCGARFNECPTWSAIFRRAFGGVDVEHARRMLSLTSQWPNNKELLLRAAIGLKLSPDSSDIAARAYTDNLGRLYEAIAAETGSHVIVDSSKVPSYAIAVGSLPNVDLRVAHLVRDPRATTYSWLRHIDRADAGRPLTMERLDIWQSAARWCSWNAATAVVTKLLAKPTTRISYEQFVQDPKGTLSSLLGLVDDVVPVDRARLPFVSGHEVELVPTHNVWGNHRRRRAGRVLIESDEEWMANMTPFERAVVAGVTYPLARRYGYYRNSLKTRP